MTFKDIALRNFKGNIKKYLIYFICNTFAIMIFFMYSTLIFNKELSAMVEKGVLEVLVLPNIALLVFSIFFISYCHSAFIKGRRKEFGLLMILGMSVGDIQKLVMVENIMIAIASISVGLISGTLLSRLFFLFILKAIDLTGITFHLSIYNYLLSVGVFVVIYSVSVLTTVIVIYRMKTIQLLKEDRVVQRNKYSSVFLGAGGLLLVIVALVNLYIRFNTVIEKDGELLLYSTILILIGLYAFISQLGGWLLIIVQNKSFYYNKLLFLTNINYRFRNTKKILFIIAVMVILIVFYNGFMLHLFVSSEKTATEYNPYHLAFIRTYDKNNLPLEELESILKDADNPVIENLLIEFVNIYDGYYDRMMLIPDNQISLATGMDILVSKGAYSRIFLNKYYSDKDISNLSNVTPQLMISEDRFSFTHQEDIFGIIINEVNYIRDSRLIVLNNHDFHQLKAFLDGTSSGEIHLVNYRNWKETLHIAQALNRAFEEHNSSKPPSQEFITSRWLISYEDYYKSASRAEMYNFNKQQGGMIFYLMTFLGIFFFIATCIILFLKIFSDVEYDKEKYKRLFKIGISEREVRRSIASELKLLFFFPTTLGTLLAFGYLLAFTKDMGGDSSIYISSSIITGIFFTFQGMYYIVCKKLYSEEILNSIGYEL